MYKLCKTERSADRQRQMERGLLELMLLRPYEDISVSDLCEYMQIPRKSFYRYFSSKEGALQALLDHTMMDYEGFFPSCTDPSSRTLEKELTQFFQFWYANKSLLEALFRNHLCGALVERTIQNVIQDEVIPQRFFACRTQDARKQINLFCISGLMSIVLTWHYEGYPKTAEQMAASTAPLLVQPLFPDLNFY